MLRFFMAACLVLPLCGCTAVVSAGEDQCATDNDCESRGFSGASCVDKVCVEVAVDDPIWGCLGNVVEPVADDTKTVAFPMKLVLAVDGSAVAPDTVVDVCDKLDIGCTGTDPKYPKDLHPEADGSIDVAVPEGFDGFVRISQEELVDSRIYVGRPIVEPPSVKQIQLFRPTDYSLLATLTGQELDPERGTAIVLAVDCQGDAVGGVKLDVPVADAKSIEFYLINQSPTIPPSATATDKDGFGGYFNLKPSSAVVRAFRASDDVFIGESSFQVLADTLSYVQVAPTPQSP